MESSCRLQSELRPVLRIGSTSRYCNLLYRPLYYVCSPGHKGHEDLTSSPPSSSLSPAVSIESPALPDGNYGQGLRSLRDLTQHLTARADDSHAAPVHRSRRKTSFHQLSYACQTQVRFFALLELNHIIHRLCGPPSIPLSFNLATVLPRRGT